MKNLTLWKNGICKVKHTFFLSETDGFDNWRKSSARDLSETVQTRLVAIQNPTNCTSARKVVCQFSISCGFGCRLHHAIYCLIMAYHTNRTLSFDPDQRNMVTVLWLHFASKIIQSECYHPLIVVKCGLISHLHNKRVHPTQNEPQQQGISYLEREREGVREREGQLGRSAGRHI
jgi:hypothetical protein